MIIRNKFNDLTLPKYWKYLLGPLHYVIYFSAFEVSASGMVPCFCQGFIFMWLYLTLVTKKHFDSFDNIVLSWCTGDMAFAKRKSPRVIPFLAISAPSAVRTHMNICMWPILDIRKICSKPTQGKNICLFKVSEFYLL